LGEAKGAIALIVLCVVGCFAYFYVYKPIRQREALKDVKISLKDVRVKRIGFTSATLDIRLEFYNPNSEITATLDRADYSLYGNNIYLGDGKITERVDIPPRGTRTVSTPFELSYSGAIKVVWDYLTKGGHITWRLVGTAYIDTPLGTLAVPFDLTKQ